MPASPQIPVNINSAGQVLPNYDPSKVKKMVVPDGTSIDLETLPEGKAELIKLLRDIHGYYVIKIPIIWVILIVLLILAAIGFFIYWKYYRNKGIAPLTNFEQTIQELRSLDVGAPSKEFYLEYSEIVRLYMQTEFEKTLLDKTTDEIKEILLAEDLLSTAQVLQITKSLEQGDLAKFAMAEISPEAKSEDIERAMRLVADIHDAIEKQKAYEEMMAKRELNPEKMTAQDLSKMPYDEERELAELGISKGGQQ